MRDIIDAIQAANPVRQSGNLHRRIFKLGEEYGEIMEAYLNVTSSSNGKGKTWDDVREEAVDFLIVAVDVALTPIDGQTVEDVLGDLADIELWLPNTIEDIEDLLVDAYEDAGGLATYWRGHRRLPSGAQRRNVFQHMRATVVAGAHLAFTKFPDQLNLDDEVIAADVRKEVDRKLAKWANNRDTGRVATDAE